MLHWSRKPQMSSASAMKIIVSLHDVTPFHFPRLLRAEALFREMGLRKLTYLLIPQYHAGNRSNEGADFIAWCRHQRPYEIDWQLHGHYHLEVPDSSATPLFWHDRIKRRLLTAGEAEFLQIGAGTQAARLRTGQAIFRDCVGHEPKAFVAPAWMFNAGLPSLLRDMGFDVTEDHHRIYLLDQDRSVESPVITWATRTRFRKYGSILAAPLLSHLWTTAPAVRVAIHPNDLDHHQTVGSIKRVLGSLLRNRDQAFIREADHPA